LNSQNDKEGSGRDRAAIIGGVFTLLAACVGGVFLILNTMVDNGVIVFGASNPSNSNSQATTTPIPLVTPQSSGTVNDEKCEWLQDNFPQSLEDARINFNLPASSSNFRLVYEECGATATGFIFEGDTEFELQVPEGGCIDSYSGAFFSETPVENSFGGLRVYGGTVRATGVTYRAAWCSEYP